MSKPLFYCFVLGIVCCLAVLTTISAASNSTSSYRTETLFVKPFISKDLTLQNVKAKDVFLLQPSGMCFGQSDDLFISDAGRHVIFRMSKDGVMSLVAGTGVPGYSKDGYSALETVFDTPSGIAMSPNGSLYIADTGNDVIRIVSNGIVSSIDAVFFKPLGVAVSANNMVYIADTGNNLIKKYDPTTKQLTTFAGGGYLDGSNDNVDAKSIVLRSPKNIHVVSNGKEDTVYFTDEERLKCIDSNGFYKRIDSLEGNLYGVFVDGSDIYSTSDTKHFIQKKGVESNSSLFIGQDSNGNYTGDNLVDSYSQVSFYGPKSILVKNSIIYIADSVNNCIRKVDTINKIVTTHIGGVICHPYGESIPVSSISSESSFSNPFLYKNELYFIENSNILRKVSNGLVKTVLGASQGPLIANLPTRKVFAPIFEIGLFENGDMVVNVGTALFLFNIESQSITKILETPTNFIYGISTYGKSFAEGLLAVGQDKITLFNGPSFTIPFLTNPLLTFNSESDGLYIYFSTLGTNEIWKVKASEMANATLVAPITNNIRRLVSSNGKVYTSDVSRLYEIENGKLKTIAGLPTFNVSGIMIDYYGYNGENKPLDQTALEISTFVVNNGDFYLASPNRISKISNNQVQTVIGLPPTSSLNSFLTHTLDEENSLVYFLDGVTLKKFDEKTKQISSITDSLSTVQTSPIYSFPYLFIRGRTQSVLIYSNYDKKLYIQDTCRIIQLDPLTFNYNIVAGGTTCGPISDNTIATDSKLPVQSFFTLDSNGDLYSYTNQDIYKMDKNSRKLQKQFSSAFIPSSDGPVTNTTSFGQFTSLSVKIDSNGQVSYFYSTSSQIRVIEKQSNGYYLKTLVGMSNTGYNGDNLKALETSLDRVSSIFVKSNGDILFIEATLVRQFVKSEGIVKIIAGSVNSAAKFWIPDRDTKELSFINLKGLAVNEKTNDIYIGSEKYGVRKLKYISPPPEPSAKPSVESSSVKPIVKQSTKPSVGPSGSTRNVISGSGNLIVMEMVMCIIVILHLIF